MLKIRQENKDDYIEVYNVVKEAFKKADHSDGNEQELVNALRKSKNFIPELSLVAIEDDKIVGYILFTKVEIGKNIEIALAPLAVLPEYQRQGVGKKLIEVGHSIAKKMGYHYSIVLGNEKYYSKFGYVSAIQYDIKSPFDVDSKNFMAIKLNDLKRKISGTVKYAKEFGI